MGSNTLLVASDARVYEGNPGGNYGGLSKLSVNDSPNRRFSLLFFNQPFPSGVTVLSATVRLFQRGPATGGSRTLSLQRAASAWQESTVDWDHRPNGAGVIAISAAQGNSSTDGREWSFDVRAIMQYAADNPGSWFGLRLTSNNATVMDLYAKEGGNELTPVLEVAWSDAPAAPSVLSPAAGRAVSVARPTFRFDFASLDESAELQAVHVQTSASPAVDSSGAFVTPVINSGEVAATAPEWPPGVDVTANTTYYWHARVKDAAGLWSDWSDTTTFRRTAKAAVAITNPPVSPNNVVYTQTPTFSWTVTGQTQQAFQLFIVDPDDPTEVLWTGKKTTSAITSATLPTSANTVLAPGGTYRLVLRVWDTIARESIPEEAVYVEVVRDFTAGTSSSTTGVTALAVTPSSPDSPFLTATWQRTTAPDEFVVMLGDKVAAVMDPADVFVSGTTYSYELRVVPPRAEQTIAVMARVGTSTSDPETATATTRTDGLWLYSVAADGPAICIKGDDPVTAEASEDTAVFNPPGSINPVLISSIVRGPVGDVAGFIDPGSRADWDALSAKRAITLGMTRVDLAARVQIYDTVRSHQNEGVAWGGDDTIPIAFKYIEIR